MSDERFRAVNDYALAHRFRAGFPNFHEAAYGDGIVYGTHLLRDGVAQWHNVPRAELNVNRIEDVPAVMRAANDWGAARGAACTFANFHQAADDTGKVYYGVVTVSGAAVEFHDVPRVELGVYHIEDVPAMMRAAHDWAVRHGFATGLPTFHQAAYNGVVVCGVQCFRPGFVTWRDVPADLLAAYVHRNDKPWVVVLCHLSDEARGDRQRWVDFFEDGGADAGGAWRYWRDVGYGLAPSARVTDWYDLGHTRAELDTFQAPQEGRRVVAGWARDVADATERFDRHHVVVALAANSRDHGATGDIAVLTFADATPLSPTFIVHEMGHALGLDHSFTEAAKPCATGDARPGAYCDRWDIMSAANVGSFADVHGRPCGPGLAAPNLVRLGWLHRSRVWRGFPLEPVDLRLPALHRNDLDGYLAARIQLHPFASPVYVEYRQRDSWDAGLDRDAAVLVHGTEGGLTRLLTSLGGGLLTAAGTDLVVPGFFPVVVRVLAIDRAAMAATVRLWALPVNGARRVRIARIVYNPTGLDWAGEYVALRNDTAAPVDLTGWTLADRAGHRYVFPARVLHPGGTIRVWTGPGADDADDLFMGRFAAVWNNWGDTATVRDKVGAVVATYSYGTG